MPDLCAAYLADGQRILILAEGVAIREPDLDGNPISHLTAVLTCGKENVDSPEQLADPLYYLVALSLRFERPARISTRPRTRKRLEPLPKWAALESRTFIDWLDLHSQNQLQRPAARSHAGWGTIADESDLRGFHGGGTALLDRAARAPRDRSIVLADLNPLDFVAAADVCRRAADMRDAARLVTAEDYLISNTSEGTL